MGLDWRPMGKPKPGYENRFNELYSILTGSTKPANKEELHEEWFSIQIPTYETVKAPLVGRDKEADDWIKEQYEESEKDVSLEEFVEEMKGYYVILLAKELDGVPAYAAMGQPNGLSFMVRTATALKLTINLFLKVTIRKLMVTFSILIISPLTCGNQQSF